MEAKVNEGCISCGACVAACPEVFRFNDDGEAEAYEKVKLQNKHFMFLHASLLK